MTKLLNVLFIAAMINASYGMEKEEEKILSTIQFNEESLDYKLAIATLRKDTKEIKQLFSEGANPYQLCSSENGVLNAVYLALDPSNSKALQLFLQHPNTKTEINKPVLYYNSPEKSLYALHIAVVLSENTVRLLLDTKMMDVYILSNHGTALGVALTEKKKGSAKLLLEHIDTVAKLGDPREFFDKIINEPYLCKDYKPCDSQFCTEILPLLYKKGLSVNLQNVHKKNNTPLHEAIESISLAMLRLQAFQLTKSYLIVKGESVILKATMPVFDSNKSEQPVEDHMKEAVKQQKSIIERGYQVISFLLNHHADLEFRNNDNDTPLMLAASLGRSKVIEQIILTQKNDSFVDWDAVIAKANTPHKLLSNVEFNEEEVGREYALVNLLKENNTKNAVELIQRYRTAKQNIMNKTNLSLETAYINAQHAIAGFGQDYFPTKQEIENKIKKLRNENADEDKCVIA